MRLSAESKASDAPDKSAPQAGDFKRLGATLRADAGRGADPANLATRR